MKRCKTAVTAALMTLFATMLLLQGCALFPKSDPDRPGYQEGRTTAFFYVLTKPALPEEIQEAVEEGYLVLRISTGDGVIPGGEAVKEAIDTFYMDESPAFREMVYNFYTMAVSRLESAVFESPEVSTATVLGNFLTGIEDALEVWTVTDAPPAPIVVPDKVEPPSPDPVPQE